MSVFSNLEDLDNQLTQRSQNVREIIELRKKILKSIDPAQKNLLDFIDIAYLENDLSSQAYIRERKNLVESYHDPVKAGPIDEFRYKSLEQDLGYLDNVISAEQYVERKNHLLKEFADKVSSERIQNVDRKFLNEALSPKEYLEQKRSILDQLYGLKATVIPDARNVVISQRMLFLITIIFGVYFIILPQSNYYSKISTVVYFVGIGSGLYGYFFRHKPKPDYEPYVSVIIPVYNGEKDIYNIIKSHVETDYPHDKLEILIANDESEDRTVNEVRRAIIDFPNVYIRHLRYEKNGGKRQVIRKAFDESTGEVIVRCDADTYLDKDSIGKLVSHLKDREIGGVTGFTRVKNWKTNIVTKIQRVRYNYAYQQLYSFHNLLGSIYCLPGCFSAYCRSAIEPFIVQWGETKPTLSEDRHMAHLLLENGYKTLFVKDALSYTDVPDTWKSYLKQQFRWGKANVLQQLRATTFMPQMSFKLLSFYMITYFVALTTPFAILRLIFGATDWVRWLILVSLSALLRGLITEGFNISAVYAVPLFYFHLMFDLVRPPWGLLTIKETD